MDLPSQMITFNNVTVCLIFGEILLTSVTKLALVAKASICSTIKRNLLLYCPKFSAFVIAVSI